MAYRKKNRAIHRADTRGGRFIGIPYSVLQSESYRTLSYPARATLIEIAMRLNGFNNGKIVVSQRQIMEGLGTKSPKTVVEAVAQLMEHGLISIEAEGDHYARRAREFRLTYVNTTNGNGKHVPATNDYLLFEAPEENISGSVDEPEDYKTGAFNASDGELSDTVKEPNKNTKTQNIKELTEMNQHQTDTASTLHITKPYPSQIGWGISRNEIIGQYVTYIDQDTLKNVNDNECEPL